MLVLTLSKLVSARRVMDRSDPSLRSRSLPRTSRSAKSTAKARSSKFHYHPRRPASSQCALWTLLRRYLTDGALALPSLSQPLGPFPVLQLAPCPSFLVRYCSIKALPTRLDPSPALRMTSSQPSSGFFLPPTPSSRPALPFVRVCFDQWTCSDTACAPACRLFHDRPCPQDALLHLPLGRQRPHLCHLR